MKKILSLVLAAVLSLLVVSCGGSLGDDLQAPSEVTAGGNDPAQSNDEKSEQPETADAAIEETVLVDQDGVKITAKSLNMDGLLGAELKLLIENNSGKDLTVQCQNASVNGYMVDPVMSVDVANGKKANEALAFMESDFEECGIINIADIDLSFHVFTTEDWETYLDTPQVQLKTSIADTYEYAFDDSGEVAYDADGIKVIIKGLSDEDSILGPGIKVFLVNDTDKALTFQTRDVSVNGFMVDPVFSSEVVPGKKSIDAITFMDSDLEENDITSINDVELSFTIFDSESWDNTIDTDVIKITF
ncbi:hypothetical protein H8702_06815 [Massilimaliae timonensis]|uniref:Lipoprotein n=1 Tax=Massiliimalia timonensis TaxID=1987501 RepID=A0A8J6PJB7_9FIRM|nr:hypothetical protein [Massiliimalia timonensis]MBC8610835.1 hypothetical protein [Massiliimalia timonensis]